MMNICIAGWYFRPTFYKVVRDSGYPAVAILHREGNTQGVPFALYENRGLEFGCYRSYVEHHWDGVSDVLFMHDDTEILDPDVALSDIENMATMGIDHAYIFPDEYHEFINGGAHGRAMWIKGSLLQKIAHDFPADLENTGVNIGKIAQNGIFAFHDRVMELSRNAGVIAIVPQFRMAHRGRLHDRLFAYRKTVQGTPGNSGAVPGGLVNVAE